MSRRSVSGSPSGHATKQRDRAGWPFKDKSSRSNETGGRDAVSGIYRAVGRMTNSLKQGHALARRFEEAWNAKDFVLFDEILHPEMIWHVAVSSPGDSQRAPFQSKLLKECGVSWPKTVYSKRETLDIFSHTLRSFATFTLRIRSITAEDDRVAVEAEGNALHANGRRYDNHYCYIFQIRDGQISLFREYQDTLLVFDVNFVA